MCQYQIIVRLLPPEKSFCGLPVLGQSNWAAIEIILWEVSSNVKKQQQKTYLLAKLDFISYTFGIQNSRNNYRSRIIFSQQFSFCGDPLLLPLCPQITSSPRKSLHCVNLWKCRSMSDSYMNNLYMDFDCEFSIWKS